MSTPRQPSTAPMTETTRCAHCTSTARCSRTSAYPASDALHERRAVPPLRPHGAVAERRHLRVRRLRQYPVRQLLARRQDFVVFMGYPAPSPASSTSPTTSPRTTTAGSTSPSSKKTTACRYYDGNSSRSTSRTTFTARAPLLLPQHRPSWSQARPRPARRPEGPNPGSPSFDRTDAQAKLIARLARGAPLSRRFMTRTAWRLQFQGDIYVGGVRPAPTGGRAPSMPIPTPASPCRSWKR